ncbi:hypothetical protein [Massilia orientalis]|uniref:Uncharacterized protein n=1 Tax=Massilia orientalis TaxID=3050128 RepID=A0ACC7MED7_9BURK|nr:hypothetical protein [Massilia sp. YIM B02787]
MPRNHLLTEKHLPELRQALDTQTLTALSASYGVSLSTMGSFLRKHGVLPEYDGWRPERYDRLLAAAARDASVAEMAALVGTNTVELKARFEQLLAMISKVGFTLSQLAVVTGVDRTYWRQYIQEGWLTTSRTGRSQRLPVAELVRAANARPELFDYQAVPLTLAKSFGLSNLPAPPLFKMVTCRSTSIESRVIDILASSDGPRISYKVESCEAIGGVDLWAPLYTIATCPRCGLRVSRFSEKQRYADEPGDSAPVKDAMASKVGLRWRCGTFETLDGQVLDQRALERHITRIAQRNSRERDRKLKLIADIEQYDAGGSSSIL